MGDVAGHEFHGNQFGAGGGSSGDKAKEHDAKSLADRAAARFHGDMEKSHKAAAKAATTPQEKDAHKAAAHVHGMAAQAAKEGKHTPEHAAAAKAVTDIANKHTESVKEEGNADAKDKSDRAKHDKRSDTDDENAADPKDFIGKSKDAISKSEFAKSEDAKPSISSDTKSANHVGAANAHREAASAANNSAQRGYHEKKAAEHDAAAKALRPRQSEQSNHEGMHGFKTGVGAGHDASKGKISDEAKFAQASTRHPAGLAAREASNKAERQSAQATGPFAHGMASAMHENAAKANRTAGNHMAAAEHDAMAKHHAEAAGGTKYDAATKTFGPNTGGIPRTKPPESELHQDSHHFGQSVKSRPGGFKFGQ